MDQKNTSNCTVTFDITPNYDSNTEYGYSVSTPGLSAVDGSFKADFTDLKIIEVFQTENGLGAGGIAGIIIGISVFTLVVIIAVYLLLKKRKQDRFYNYLDAPLVIERK